MPLSTIFIATCSKASTLGDFISRLGLASHSPARKKQLLCFAQHLGGEWMMTSEQEMEREKKEQFGQSAETGAEGREDFIRLLLFTDADLAVN